jgi:predicted DNA-binding transcriptional regulator AlpA
MISADRKRLRARASADYLAVSRSTLSKWRMNGMGPPHHRCGPRLVYYFKDELDAWLAECDRRCRPAGPKRA